MQITGLDYYLISVNIVGFVLFIINTLLYTYTAEGQIDLLLTICSVLGGSLGIVLAILIFDRTLEKGNMMSRVFVICAFVIQLCIFLFFRVGHAEQLTLKFWEFFDRHKVLIIYLVVINFVSCVVYGVDKLAAVEHTWRIRIVTLLGLALAGGSVGALIAMYAFRHKTSVDYFAIGVPLIILAQIVALFYVMNR